MANDDKRSSSYLYNLRQRYGTEILNDFLERDRLQKILLAERLKGQDLSTKTEENRKLLKMQACKEVDDILAACIVTEKEQPKFMLEGAMIARFLADNGFDPKQGV